MVNSIENIDINQFLKLYQMNGFTRNLTIESEMWDNIKKYKVMDAKGRFLKFLLNDALGYAAVQALPADGTGSYPRGQRSSLKEASAHYKEWAWTVTVPRVILNKQGGLDFEYANSLAVELDNKQAAFARLKCIEMQGDGVGAIGVISAISVISSGPFAGSFLVTIDGSSANAGRSFIRWFQEKDHVKAASAAGVAHTTVATATNAAYLSVANVDDSVNQVVLTPYSSADVQQTAVAAQFNLAVGDLLYRKGQALVDTTAITSSTEYETLNHTMVGLESLFADDGRLVHGINKSGNYRATVKGIGGKLLDNAHFQSALSTAKRRAGQQKYSYKKAFMADEAYDSLVSANETDRRFGEIEDIKRGFKTIGYKHRKDQIEFVPDEFVHRQRIWILPEGNSAIGFAGGMPMQVKPNGSDPMHLSISTDAQGQTQYGRENETFFEQQGVLITKHAAPIVVLKDFAVVNP